jgi:hypothetical protein
MRKLLPIAIFVSVIAAIILRSVWPTLPKLIGPNSAFHNPGQILGGPNSVFNNPGQILGGGGSVWTPVLTVQVAITLIFVAASLFVILSKWYAPAERHWAYGALGTILGFWLRAT